MFGTEDICSLNIILSADSVSPWFFNSVSINLKGAFIMAKYAISGGVRLFMLARYHVILMARRVFVLRLRIAGVL